MYVLYMYHKETKFLLFEVETYRTYSHGILGCDDYDVQSLLMTTGPKSPHQVSYRFCL